MREETISAGGTTLEFIDENLMPEEAVIYCAKLHWIIYASSFILFAFAAFLLLLTIAVHGSFFPMALATATGGGVLFLRDRLKSETFSFAVTDRRVLVKVGILRRQSLELVLQKIEGIHVDQGPMGRILGYGTITVIGTGGTKEPFKSIANPLEFRRQVLISTHAVQAH